MTTPRLPRDDVDATIRRRERIRKLEMGEQEVQWVLPGWWPADSELDAITMAQYAQGFWRPNNNANPASFPEDYLLGPNAWAMVLAERALVDPFVIAEIIGFRQEIGAWAPWKDIRLIDMEDSVQVRMGNAGDPHSMLPNQYDKLFGIESPGAIGEWEWQAQGDDVAPFTFPIDPSAPVSGWIYYNTFWAGPETWTHFTGETLETFGHCETAPGGGSTYVPDGFFTEADIDCWPKLIDYRGTAGERPFDPELQYCKGNTGCPNGAPEPTGGEGSYVTAFYVPDYKVTGFYKASAYGLTEDVRIRSGVLPFPITLAPQPYVGQSFGAEVNNSHGLSVSRDPPLFAVARDRVAAALDNWPLAKQFYLSVPSRDKAVDEYGWETVSLVYPWEPDGRGLEVRVRNGFVYLRGGVKLPPGLPYSAVLGGNFALVPEGPFKLEPLRGNLANPPHNQYRVMAIQDGKPTYINIRNGTFRGSPVTFFSQPNSADWYGGSSGAALRFDGVSYPAAEPEYL